MPNLQSNLGLLTTHRHRPLELTIGTILLLSKWRDWEKNPTPPSPTKRARQPRGRPFLPPSIGRMSFSQRREGTLRRAAGRRSRVAGHHSPVVDPGQTLALLVYERRRRRRRLSSRCGRQGTAPPIARFGGGEPFCARDGIKRPQPSSQLRLLGQAGVRECRAIGRWRDPSLLRLYVTFALWWPFKLVARAYGPRKGWGFRVGGSWGSLARLS